VGLTDPDPLRTSIAAELGSLAEAARAVASPEAVALPAGVVIGEHFELEGVLGRGGMGVVYRARDRRLDRRVALKLELRGADLARVQREATALARLAHPNVVTIYEVGEHAGAGFVAMELCPGGSVRAWLAAAPRPWRAILDVFVAAGRGLAAAHAAGLVHRDIKPDNLLLGDDGRTRVADFGLARDAAGLISPGGGAAAIDAATVVGGSADTAHAPTLPSPSQPSGGSDRLTQTGAMVGTPRYMAPEQFAGGVVDARADQFAFAVALYEALAGVDPFPATLDARLAAIAAGAIATPRRAVPRRVLRPLIRALAAAPAARWPSLDALVRALTAAARPRGPWIAAGVGVIAAVAATVLATQAWGPARQPTPPGCEPLAARLRGVWDDDARAALAATGARAAGAAAAIDARLATWATLREAACRDVGRGGEAAATAVVRLTCLTQRLADTDALVTHLRTAPTAPRATELVEQLAPVELCGDAAAFVRREPQPTQPAVRDAVIADRATLYGAELLSERGQLAAARTRLDAVTTPRGVFPPLDAERDRVAAEIARAAHDPDAAAALRRAVAAAAAANHPRAQVKTLLALAVLLGDGDQPGAASTRSEVDTVLAMAEGLVRGLGDDPELRAAFFHTRATIRLRQGDVDGAIADATAARDAWIAHGGATTRDAIAARAQLGAVLVEAGRHEEARQVLTAALTDAERALPADHAIVQGVVSNLAVVCGELGDLAAARTYHERALAAARATFGDDSVEADEQRLNLSGLLLTEGHVTEAVPLLEAVLAGLDRRGQRATPNAAMVEGNLGIALIDGRDPAAAVAHLERSLALFEAALGPDHPQLIGTLIYLATALRRSGHGDAAAPHARRALAIAEATYPATSQRLVKPLATLALALAEADPPQARALAERARRVSGGAPSSGDGEAALALAIALARQDQRPRARAEAERAVALLTAAGPRAAASLAEAAAWLAAHR
jgi:tetratricopeptide (TPR) repeat protein/tRNA A-37 threonylcarbamoyl transferase component Bud32